MKIGFGITCPDPEQFQFGKPEAGTVFQRTRGEYRRDHIIDDFTSVI